MSDKQVKKYRKIIRKQMKKDRDIFIKQFVSQLKGASFFKRFKYAIVILRGV